MIFDRIRGTKVEKVERVWSVGIKCNVCGDPGVLYVRGTLDSDGKGTIEVKLADNLKDGHWEEVILV